MRARKSPTSKVSVQGAKIPKVAENISGSYFQKNPSWRFSNADISHKKWSILDSHEDIVVDPNDKEDTILLHQFSKSIDRNLLDSLSARESTTWGDLLTASGGRTRGTNSHNIPMEDIVKDAQVRAEEIGIVEDGLLSLRLDGKNRVFGIMNDGVLNIIWFDREHEICPSNRN